MIMRTNTEDDAVSGTLDPVLYRSCQGDFSGSQLREILQAAAGIKVARIVLSERQKMALSRTARRHGFCVIQG